MRTDQALRRRCLFKGDETVHDWGSELLLENNGLYCAKLLILDANTDYQSSLHYHMVKDETFIVLSGKVALTILTPQQSGQVIDGCLEKQRLDWVEYKAGDKVRVAPKCLHRFHALSEEAIILEVSTPDTGDNVKIVPARRIQDV